MSITTQYLENYVESTGALPADLTRILNTIKSLDERSADLMENVKAHTEQLVALPSQAVKKGKEDQDFKELQARVAEEERMLLQFAEEKVQLAQQAIDALSMHLNDLDQVLEQFEAEMVATEQQPAPAEYYNPFENVGGGSSKRGARYQDQWDSLEPLQAPSKQRGVGTGGHGGGHGHGLPPSSAGGTTRGKRVREDRSAAASAAAATAAVLADGEDYMEGDMAGAVAAAGQLGQPPLGFTNNEATADLQDSSAQPQLPGRMLTLQDIRADLQGKKAEMFWPDDNMWYLIEIHRVNVSDRTATIVYRTGEVEDLNLQEIVQEGHMSLIEA